MCICMCTITRAPNKMTVRAYNSHSAACERRSEGPLFGVTRRYLTYYNTIWRDHPMEFPRKVEPSLRVGKSKISSVDRAATTYATPAYRWGRFTKGI
jgi:hypothetical protein